MEEIRGFLRDDLNRVVPRVMGVLNPIKLVITNYPEREVEWLLSVNNPKDLGVRVLEIFLLEENLDGEAMTMLKQIENGLDSPQVKQHVSKSAYIVEYENHIEDENGNETEVHEVFPENSKSGSDTSGIKAKGMLHWVEAHMLLMLKFVFIDRLFVDESPDGHKDKNFVEFLIPTL